MGNGGEASREAVAYRFLSRLSPGFVFRDKRRGAVRATLEELRLQCVHTVEFFVQRVIDGDDDIGLEWTWLYKAVVVIEEDRIVSQVRRVGAEEGHGDHIGGVLYDEPDIPVV